MRPERYSDDESDSYPRIGYQHFIDSSRACLALARIFHEQEVGSLVAEPVVIGI